MSSRYDFETDVQTTRRMKRVRTTDTLIEQKVQGALNRSGICFTLGNADILGKPDIVLHDCKTAIFVHGCFWHGHSNCKKGVVRPRRNAGFWEKKIAYNMEKDTRTRKKLEEDGWEVIVIWECEVSDDDHLDEVLSNRLGRYKVRNNESTECY